MNSNRNFLPFFIIFLTSFLLGMGVSFYIGININNELLKNKETEDIVSILKKDDLDLTKLFEVYNLMKEYNYNSDIIDKNVLVNHAIKGLVEGLDDKHSEFYTIEETKKFNEALSGDFEGIGAVVEKNPMGVMIDRILKGSPAKKFGLISGDIIIKANDTVLEGMNLYDAVAKIKGPAGTKVVLEVLRIGERDILTFDVTRDKIKIPSVDSKMIENTNIGYISINMFGESTDFEFINILKEYSDTDGIILDLRDNGGGYLQSATIILSNFVENDKVLVTTKNNELLGNISYPSINDGNIYDGKIVVLINENSASASEITAGALKDYKKAILVGKKSYGKGSVQKPFELNDSSMLKLTVANWFTPNDINIDKEGITPDIEVDFKKEDYTPEEGKEEEFVPYDRQFEVAKEVLNIFIEKGAYQLSIDDYKNNIKE